MSTNPALDTYLNIIFRTEFDMGKAYSVGLQIAKEKGVSFNGLFLWNLTTTPLNVAEYLWFTIKEADLDEVLTEVLKRLGIPRTDVHVTASPAPKPAIQSLPKATETYR